MYDCNLEDEAMQKLAPGLERAPMKSLDLDSNRGITAIGLEALAKGIASPRCKLEKLDVQRCDLDDAAIQKFSAHLPSMAPLQSLAVSYNNLSEQSKSELKAAWQKAGKSIDKLQT